MGFGICRLLFAYLPYPAVIAAALTEKIVVEHPRLPVPEVDPYIAETARHFRPSLFHHDARAPSSLLLMKDLITNLEVERILLTHA